MSNRRTRTLRAVRALLLGILQMKKVLAFLVPEFGVEGKERSYEKPLKVDSACSPIRPIEDDTGSIIFVPTGDFDQMTRYQLFKVLSSIGYKEVASNLFGDEINGEQFVALTTDDLHFSYKASREQARMLKLLIAAEPEEPSKAITIVQEEGKPMVFTVRNEEQLERATRGLHSCLCEVFEGGSSIRMMSFEDLQDNGVYTLLSADLTADQRKILIANFVQIRDNSFEALGVQNLLTFLNDFGAYMVVTSANMACNGTVYGVGGVVTSEVGTLFIEGRLSASEGHIAIDQLETIISAFSTCTGDATFTKSLARTSNVNNDVHIKPLLQKSALSGKVFGVFFTENLDESVLAKCIEKNICYIYNTGSGYTPSPWTPFTFVVSAARLNTTGGVEEKRDERNQERAEELARVEEAVRDFEDFADAIAYNVEHEGSVVTMVCVVLRERERAAAEEIDWLAYCSRMARLANSTPPSFIRIARTLSSSSREELMVEGYNLERVHGDPVFFYSTRDSSVMPLTN